MIKTLRIQLTNECNFTCVYCCHEGTKCDYSILKNRNLVSVIRAAHDVLGIKRVKFTGGEPLEYDEDISSLIRNINRPNITYSIVTNATQYGTLKTLIDSEPATEVTVSLPVPPSYSYISTYKAITGSVNEYRDFKNVIDFINHMVSTNKTLKINYVLCREFNTSYSCIKDIIRYAMDHPSVKLRFLETAVNDTNNHDGRMSKYIFTQKEFEDILIEIGYQKSIENKRSDSRSSCLYDINGCVVKFIKFFCNNNCDECPEDKTSLWLTSTGEIKKCSYRRTATRIENWNYERIARQLEIFIDPICE